MRALVLVLNKFTHDSRVLREVQTLAGRGYEVQVFALHEGALPLQEDCPAYHLRRFKLLTRPWPKYKPVQLLKYLECAVRMIYQGVAGRPKLVHANDIDCLPMGVMIAGLCGAKLVYDAHELWFDVNHSGPYPKWQSWATKKLERSLARQADAVVTVCDSIALHMARTLNISVPQVVRNIPSSESITAEGKGTGLLHQALSLDAEIPLVLNLGMLSPGRGVETLIKAMCDVPAPAAAVFLGSHDASAEQPGQPTYLQSLQCFARALGVGPRVYFLPSVPPAEVHRYTRDATIGVAPIEPICLSLRYALPNKLFQYIQAGLPVVVSDLPEMAGIVNRYQIGEIFPPADSAQLASALNRLLSSPALLAKYRSNAFLASQELSWEKEQEKLDRIYQRLAGMAPATPIGTGA